MNEMCVDSKICPDRVNELFLECLFETGEDTSAYVKADGIGCSVGFHPGRLAEREAEIAALLEELPVDFRQPGGASFLHAFSDREGRQWTGLHKRMEQLFQLGVGIGKVVCTVPRQKWRELPGGMPFYLIR